MRRHLINTMLFALLVPMCRSQSMSPWLLVNFSDSLEVQLTNSSDHGIDTLAVVPVKTVLQTALRFPGSLAIAVIPGKPMQILPSQADDLDGDGNADEFLFPIKMTPHSKLIVHIYYSTTLHDTLPWPKRVHASHNFGYNHATVALESEAIGYRTYGGLFFDVQARDSGAVGLQNELVGYFSAASPSPAGRDVIHLGDTLGLGGIFLRKGTAIFRPSMNVPDYAHLPENAEAPVYRVVADGPLRAIVKASIAQWKVGDETVRVEAIYSIDAREETVRCKFQIIPLTLNHEYEVGAGMRALPEMHSESGPGRIAIEGEEDPKVGKVGLALYFDPTVATVVRSVRTKGGDNEAIIFRDRLKPGHAVSGEYSFAATWSGSGVSDLLAHLREVKDTLQKQPAVDGYRHMKIPNPERLEGEAK